MTEKQMLAYKRNFMRKRRNLIPRKMHGSMYFSNHPSILGVNISKSWRLLCRNILLGSNQ